MDLFSVKRKELVKVAGSMGGLEEDQREYSSWKSSGGGGAMVREVRERVELECKESVRTGEGMAELCGVLSGGNRFPICMCSYF